MKTSGDYHGRFAPSPTGPLHAGSLVAALASWLDARAHGGRWSVRIEDVDRPRCIAGMGEHILQQLAACGLHSDTPVWWQAQRTEAYRAALANLQQREWAYPCACSRKAIEMARRAKGEATGRHEAQCYPGTCRPPLGQANTPGPWAWRLDLGRVEHALSLPTTVVWHDRRLGPQTQTVSETVGDFVLHRADGLWAYQLAVVVDDAAQGITHVVRGSDLADNTARQIRLQQALDLPRPRYLHTPLVYGARGEKLSKQNGALALRLDDPVATLGEAAQVLGLPSPCGETVAQVLSAWVGDWAQIWGESGHNKPP